MEIADLDNLTVLRIIRNVPRDDGVPIVRSINVDFIAIDLNAFIIITFAVILEGHLMVLIRSTVQDKNCLVVVLLPGEDLSGRVNDVLVADRVVADVDLGVATVHYQTATVLGDLNIAVIDGADLQAILHGVCRAVLRVAGDVELGRVRLRRRDGDRVGVGVVQ